MGTSLASLECDLPDPFVQPITLENDTALEGILQTMVYSDGFCRCCLSVACHCCGSRVLKTIELPGELGDRLSKSLQCNVKIVHAGNRWAVI